MRILTKFSLFHIILLTDINRTQVNGNNLARPVRDTIWVEIEMSINVPSRTGRDCSLIPGFYLYWMPNGMEYLDSFAIKIIIPSRTQFL